jgi:hypothetical protein
MADGGVGVVAVAVDKGVARLDSLAETKPIELGQPVVAARVGVVGQDLRR